MRRGRRQLERARGVLASALLGRDWRERLMADVRADLLERPSVWGPERRVHIAATAQVNDALINTSSGDVYVADHVLFGHRVCLVTGTHDPDRHGAARMAWWPTSGRDIHIDEAAWLGTNAVVVGPCRVGRNAVVAAGAVVRDDVPAYAVVAGVPARIIRMLERDPTQVD